MKPSKSSIYLDYASTTPIRKEVLDTYQVCVQNYFYNSESVYTPALQVHDYVEASRKKIAEMLQVHSDEVFFTSGASEANSLAITGYALKNQHKGKHLITTKMEHSSVLHAFEQLEALFGFEVTYLDVNKEGLVSLEQVQEAIRKDTILLSIMAINNEVGSIQPIEKIVDYIKSQTRICMMSDGVQLIGKHDLSLQNIDLFTFTTHKIYGVKGCGILIKKRNIELVPIVHGGAQEQGLRGGTIDAPSCIVAAKTLRLIQLEQQKSYQHVVQLRDTIFDALTQMEQVHLNSTRACSPYIINFSVHTMNSEILMNALNERGIYISSQSACSTRTKSPSHTLLAMGYDEKHALSAVRISLSHLTTKEEVSILLENLKEILYAYST